MFQDTGKQIFPAERYFRGTPEEELLECLRNNKECIPPLVKEIGHYKENIRRLEEELQRRHGEIAQSVRAPRS